MCWVGSRWLSPKALTSVAGGECVRKIDVCVGGVCG